MKKIFFALMAVAAIAIVGCKDRHEVNDPTDPEAPENGRDRSALVVDTNGANQPNLHAPIRMPLSTRE